MVFGERVRQFGVQYKKTGADGRNRTDDLRFTKPLLYQLSYIGLKTLQRIMRMVRTAVNLFSLHRRHWQARQNAFVSVTPPTASTAKARAASTTRDPALPAKAPAAGRRAQ